MAENKKSFYFYTDWGATFDELSDEDAGKLIKHLCDYVRDKNPETDNILIKAVFANIKNTLKRDLIKWEGKSERNSIIAKEGWEKRKNANASERIKQDAINADRVKDKVIVKDKVSVSDIVKEKEIKDVAKKNLQLSEYQICVDFWLQEFHKGWTFNGQQGKALKSIILKIKKVLKDGNKEINKNSIFESFKFICLKLPEWYKTKDLQVLDSKFNEIVQEIKNPKNGKSDTESRKQSVSELKNLATAILDDFAAKNGD